MATDSDLRTLERHYHQQGHGSMVCDASSGGNCYHPACRCRCHRWAREVLAYLGAQRAAEARARATPPTIHITMGPTPGPSYAERDMQDAARRAAHERQMRG